MKKPFDAADFLISRAGGDYDFRERLLARPKETIEAELGVTMAEDHEIHVHEETYTTPLLGPPRRPTPTPTASPQPAPIKTSVSTPVTA